MTTVFTDYGAGEVVKTERTHGRTRHKVAGAGFSVWMDAAEVDKRTAAEEFGRSHTHVLPADRRPESDWHREEWATDLPGERLSEDEQRRRFFEDWHKEDPGDPWSGEYPDDGGVYTSESPGYRHGVVFDPDEKDWREERHHQRRHHPGEAWSDVHPTHGDDYAYTSTSPDYYRAAATTIEPAGKVNESNSTTLPYNPTPQFPVQRWWNQETILPGDQEIDRDERLSPSDSRTFKDRQRNRPWPGPDPKLFAKAGYYDDDRFDDPADAAWGDDEWHKGLPDVERTRGKQSSPIDFPHLRPGEEVFYPEGSGPENELMITQDPYRHFHGPHGFTSGVPGVHHVVSGTGIEMWHPAGLSDKYAPIIAKSASRDDPVQRFRDDPLGEISRVGTRFARAHDEEAMNKYALLIEADEQLREAAWNDVRDKAMRLREEGRVRIHHISHNDIFATVEGDHDTYDVMISKSGAYGGLGQQGISTWVCTCPWGSWAFKRKVSYIGRLCSHGYACFLEMQAKHMREHPEHFTKSYELELGPGTKQRRYRTHAKTAGGVVDDFKSYIKDDNYGQVDQHAADDFVYTPNSDYSAEDAQKVYDYVRDHATKAPEREFDVPYTFDPEKVYKEGSRWRELQARLDAERLPYPPELCAALQRQADLLRTSPESLTPSLRIVETDDDDKERFVDVEKDERKTTGPDGITTDKKAAGRNVWPTGPRGEMVDHDTGREADMWPTGPGGEWEDRNQDEPELIHFSAEMLPGLFAQHETSGGGGGAAHLDSGISTHPGGDTAAAGGTAPMSGGATGDYAKPLLGAPAPTGGGSYQVQSGDTLSDIAERAGLGAGNYQGLADANNISNPDLITPGQTINIPHAAALHHSHVDVLGNGYTPRSIWKIAPQSTLSDDPAGGGDSGDDDDPLVMPTGPGVQHETTPRPSGGSRPGGGTPSGATPNVSQDLTPGPGNAAAGGRAPASTPSAGAPTVAPGWAPGGAPTGGGDFLPPPRNLQPGGPVPPNIWGPPAETIPQIPGMFGQLPGMGIINSIPGIGLIPRMPTGARRFAAASDDNLLERLRDLAHEPIDDDLGKMDTRNDEVVDIVEELRDRGADVSQIVAYLRYAADEEIPPGGSFEAPGGGDWAADPFEGSGPDPKPWFGTSEDYVDENERPDFRDVTEEGGKTGPDGGSRPPQGPRGAARYYYADNPDPGIYAQPSQPPLPTDISGSAIGVQGGAGMGDYAAPPTQPVTRSAAENPDPGIYAQPQDAMPAPGGMAPMSGGAPGDYVTPPASSPSGGGLGGFGDASGKASDLMGQWANAGSRSAGVKRQRDQIREGMFDEASEMPVDYGTPQHREIEASGEPIDGFGGNDVVRQFQANIGGTALSGDAPAGGGDYSDSAIAERARGFLRTAGRHYTLAEQRELENESHVLGARNMPTTDDLIGTHYLDG